MNPKLAEPAPPRSLDWYWLRPVGDCEGEPVRAKLSSLDASARWDEPCMSGRRGRPGREALTQSAARPSLSVLLKGAYGMLLNFSGFTDAVGPHPVALMSISGILKVAMLSARERSFVRALGKDTDEAEHRADLVELTTGAYAEAFSTTDAERNLSSRCH